MRMDEQIERASIHTIHFNGFLYIFVNKGFFYITVVYR